MRWIEIDTDTRYLEDADLSYEMCMAHRARAWPPAVNIFERRLAFNLREQCRLDLDLDTFIRVIGKSAQDMSACVTLEVSLINGLIQARAVAIDRNVMPPITADVAGRLAFALRWYGMREPVFRVTVSPQNLFWILPLQCFKSRSGCSR